MGIFISINLLSITGCATLGANLALDLAKAEEAKGCAASYSSDVAKVGVEDCERISRLIKKAGVPGGFVGYDHYGRIELKGSYLNEDQVEMAFMTAWTVVGMSSMDISPVTPRDLQEIRMVKSYMPQLKISGKGNKYALLIGISKFQYPHRKVINGITPIQTAVKDVELIEEKLKKNGFKQSNIISLKDEEATKSNILNAMRDLESKVTSNDSVVFYISTHGTPPTTFGKMGIIPYDMKAEILDHKSKTVQQEANEIPKDETGDEKIIEIVKRRIASLKTAVSFDDIQDFITSINTDKFIAILDTCYSGSALGALSYPLGGIEYAEREKNYSQSLSPENKAELLGGEATQACALSDYPDSITKRLATAFSNNTSGAKGMYSEEQYPAHNNGTAPQQTIDSDYMFDRYEQLKTTFSVSNTEPQRGKVMITATNSGEQSLFDDPDGFNLARARLPNSFFTFYLANGLDKFHGQIFKAFDYAKVRTENLVARDYSPKKQTPEMLGTPSQCLNIDVSK